MNLKSNTKINYSLFFLICLISFSTHAKNSHAELVASNNKQQHRKSFSKRLNKAEKMVDMAGDTYRAGNPNRAYQLLEQALTIFPGYARAYYNRGLLKAERQDVRGAIADYTKAIEMYPDDLSAPKILHLAYNNRGLLYNELNDNSRAIADANKAISIAPDKAGYYTNRGLAYKNLEKYRDAIADYTRAIELEPNDPCPYFNRGKAYRLTDNYQKALKDLNRAILLDPNYSWAYAQRYYTYKQLGHFQQAAADYAKALQLGYQP